MIYINPLWKGGLLYWLLVWLSYVAEIIDGIIGAATLGLIYPNIGMKITCYSARKLCEKSIKDKQP